MGQHKNKKGTGRLWKCVGREEERDYLGRGVAVGENGAFRGAHSLRNSHYGG